MLIWGAVKQPIIVTSWRNRKHPQRSHPKHSWDVFIFSHFQGGKKMYINIQNLLLKTTSQAWACQAVHHDDTFVLV